MSDFEVHPAGTGARLEKLLEENAKLRRTRAEASPERWECRRCGANGVGFAPMACIRNECAKRGGR